uniref:RNA cytidine acetyltransferase n=1 Tax=Salix viminalis TaxID=40686 RepID=A0A6N2M944_SALVM
MRKKVDERIRTLIENGIVYLHYMLSKAVVKSRPTILWCYKDKLELSSHKKKRAKQVKKSMQRGLLDPEKVDPFSLFLETGGITYCFYKDSERILGNTFGMCILQDFEALTPNLLARTIETVEGGGLIVLLLRSLSSLTSLYTMVMDVHERFRTESHFQATGRFNERFLLSLATCKACVVMDDELNILPISSHIRSITPVTVKEDSEGLSEAERDLKNLKEQLHEDFPVGPLIKKCCTLDQGKAVIAFLDSVLDKTLRSTVALLAARGRGKSAALGLAVAGAIAAGYSNIFITAPSPENVKTLFEFMCKGFDAIGYKEHIDYDVMKSANPEFKKATVRINIFKQHRQTIQYIQPHEHEKLSQVELLVIDEAAAIPLPVVRSLLGPYLVFLSSTVNGYEGTGRSLSLKLLQQLEEQSQISSKNVEGSLAGRLFRKIELNESIRYASRDPIESWHNALLCLDVTNSIPSISRLPPSSECNLYYINRDTLFSYHKDSELFLQRMMALYVASHYKNSPNDLQLMADAPAHHLFVFLGPVDESKNQLPDILCVIQVCLEGQISRKSTIRSLSEGHQPFGDQIPWKFCEQFRDTVFPGFSGARIVRIATHPTWIWFCCSGTLNQVSLLEENIKPRTDLPPLLVNLHERRPEKLHYLGVSFGLTLDLFRFWKRRNFAPFYIGQIPNTVTGEYSCMVLRPLNSNDSDANGSDEWGFFGPFYLDFKRRFARLLEGDSFRSMEYKLAMSVLDPKINYTDMRQEHSSSASDGFWRSPTDDLSPHDLERLKVYTENLADFHMILDIVPILARLYFQGKLPVTLSYVPASILLCVGLQQRNITFIEEQMKLERTQILSLFMKAMKKIYKYLRGIASKEIESALPRIKEHAILGREEELENALQEHGGKINPGGGGGGGGVKSKGVKPDKHGKQESGRSGGKRSKEDRVSKSNKKGKFELSEVGT